MSPTMLALAASTLVSEDLACVAAGLLVSRGEMPLTAALLACALGIYIGDLGLWLAGRVFGARVLAWPRVRAAMPRAPERAAAWFGRHAPAIIVGSRFTPGTRLPLYLAVGASGAPLSGFAAWSALAVTLWTPVPVGLAAVFGTSAAPLIRRGALTVSLTVLAALGTWRLARRLATVRGRRELRAALARVRRWEFWPMWLFYLPVAAWTAWLAIRHGGYRTITAANPGMPDGGVVGESKIEILRRLPGKWTIPAEAIEPGPIDERTHAFAAIVADRGWRFPLILKPDVGQRGSGVRLARSFDDAARYLARMPARAVLQPYHPGPYEAGVFYYRLPQSPHGRILAITDKHFPAVAGDGASTLEALVWAHPRYRMQATTFLSRLGAAASRVPSRGERVPLGIAGNHAQGTMFTDGRHLLTPALEARIDEIARAYEGFYIGRFDVRYSDRDAFLAGRDLAIVELNGATAECTNVYDPAESLVGAYRQLFRQWQLVFEIGAANRRNGQSATPASRLARIIGAHLTAPAPLPVSD